MKKWIVIAVMGFVILCAAGFGMARFERWKQWNQAYHSAHDAYARAYDYRDGESDLFNARWLDFERARDQLNRTEPPDQDQMSRRSALVNCGDLLKSYRDLSSTQMQALRRGVPIEKLNINVASDADKSAGSCLRDID